MDKEGALTVVKTYAIIFYILSALDFLGALFIMFMGSALGGLMPFPAMPFVSGAIALIPLIMAVLLFIAGNNLRKRTETGRILAIIASILLLTSFPIGTVIGALGIYFFAFEPGVKSLFQARQPSVILTSQKAVSRHTRKVKRKTAKHKPARKKRRSR